MNKTYSIRSFVLITLFIFTMTPFLQAGQITFTPSINAHVSYDDNLNWDLDNTINDVGGAIIPRIDLEYITEKLEFDLIGWVDIIRYLEEDDFDRENYLLGIGGRYQMFNRFFVLADLEYRLDETTDSQLIETGRVFNREERTRYYAEGGLRYQLTELTNTGPNFIYQKVEYEGFNVDWDQYTISFPYTKIFQNQFDEITLEPAYSKFESNLEDADDYRIGLYWNRNITETFLSKLYGGIRFTDTKSQVLVDENEKKEDSRKLDWFGRFELEKTGLTYLFNIALSKELYGSTFGTLIDVYRVYGTFDKNLTERLGFRIYSSFNLSYRESDSLDEDKIIYFDVNPSIYYLLTENHSIYLAYRYQYQEEVDLPGDPRRERNRLWLGVNLQFPNRWN
jgi:hypothetical protein